MNSIKFVKTCFNWTLNSVGVIGTALVVGQIRLGLSEWPEVTIATFTIWSLILLRYTYRSLIEMSRVHSNSEQIRNSLRHFDEISKKHLNYAICFFCAYLILCGGPVGEGTYSSDEEYSLQSVSWTFGVKYFGYSFAEDNLLNFRYFSNNSEFWYWILLLLPLIVLFVGGMVIWKWKDRRDSEMWNEVHRLTILEKK